MADNEQRTDLGNTMSDASSSQRLKVKVDMLIDTPNKYEVSPLAPKKGFEPEDEPEDKGSTVNIIFLLWGFGVLLPWNAVLSCFDFLSDEMTGYQPAFVYPFAVNGLSAFSQMFIILYGHRISNRVKLQFSFFIAAAIIFTLPLLAHFLPNPTVKFYSCFCLLCGFGVINGAVQAQVFGFGGLLPGKYMGAIMFGNGLSGVVINLVRVIFIATFPADQLYLQAQIFFIVTALILIICGLAFDVLLRNRFFQYHKNKSGEQDQRHVDLRVAENMDNDEAREDYQNNPDEEHRKMLVKRKQIDKIIQKQKTFGEFIKQLGINFRDAWKVLSTLWLVFVVTFVVFPGTFFLSHFQFMKGDSNEFVWYTQIMILSFNVLDTVGRKAGGVLQLPPWVVYLLGIARIGLIFTTIGIGTKGLDTSSFMESDTFKIINIITFSFTNGFVSTLASIYVPQFVKEDQREQAGILIGLFICLGITSGSIIAIPVGSAIADKSYWA